MGLGFRVVGEIRPIKDSIEGVVRISGYEGGG